MTTPKQKPKQWKGFGVWHGRKFMGATPDKWLAEHHAQLSPKGFHAPVTITIAKPARRRGKAK